MTSWGISGRAGQRTALVLAAALTVALTISLGNVAESSAGGLHAVAAKKCKKSKKSAVAAKKKKCKKKKAAVPVVAPAPTPQPLTDAEVINRITQKAGEYCDDDPFCTGDFGYYSEDLGGMIAGCETKSTFSWSCYGFYEGDDGDAYNCDFREVVERDGINGIKSHLDTTFADSGFDCFLI
jgi:hypothetical protein